MNGAGQAGVQQAVAASLAGSSVAAHEPGAPAAAAAAAAVAAAAVSTGLVAVAAARQPAPGGAQGQSSAAAQSRQAAPQNPMLSAARMMAARIAGQRALQVLHGHMLHVVRLHGCVNAFLVAIPPTVLQGMRKPLLSVVAHEGAWEVADLYVSHPYAVPMRLSVTRMSAAQRVTCSLTCVRRARMPHHHQRSRARMRRPCARISSYARGWASTAAAKASEPGLLGRCCAGSLAGIHA